CTGTRRMGWTIAMGLALAAGTVVARRTIWPSMTATVLIIARRAVAARRPLSPQTPRAFVGIIAGTIITAFITSPTPAAFVTVAIPIPVSVARWWAHFVAIVVTWTKTMPMWRAIETPIG